MKGQKICGTGHRPNKLGGYTDEAFKRLTEFIRQVLTAEQPAHVISGMALGFDQALATAAMELEIPWTAAVAFKGMESRWFPKSQAYYRFLLAQATNVTIVCEGSYEARKLQQRNKWMVDHSDHVLALWNGGAGGTANCIHYAASVKRPVHNLWRQWEEWQSTKS